MDTWCWSPLLSSYFTITILSIRQTLPQNGQWTLEKYFISEKYLKTEMLVLYVSVIFCICIPVHQVYTVMFLDGILLQCYSVGCFVQV